ncbi:MAG: hypothetical protein GJT30_01290 [Geobacter sp.]|nr:hypothetical protein [Geobacter sp.]MSM38244.1 hypothetical protein [Geobacter sp.]
MTIAQISPNTVLLNPTEVNPQAQLAQGSTVTKVAKDIKKSEEKAKSDAVNISNQALKMAKHQEKLQGKK